MVTDIIRKVESWTEEKKIPEKRKNVIIDMAKMFQRGDPLPPVEERKIADIIQDMNPEDGK